MWWDESIKEDKVLYCKDNFFKKIGRKFLEDSIEVNLGD